LEETSRIPKKIRTEAEASDQEVKETEDDEEQHREGLYSPGQSVALGSKSSMWIPSGARVASK